MTTPVTAPPPIISISVAESADLAWFGMRKRHIRQAMNVVATYLLGHGYHLAYDGDLRHGGFTEDLFEIASRYERPVAGEPSPQITDYLAWPQWTSMTRHELNDLCDQLARVTKIVCLSRDGAPLDRLHYPASTPAPLQVATAFTAMRETMARNTHARVVLGGKISGYKGCIPGIAEEAMISLKNQRPLYVLGGFGGCARDIARAMKLTDPSADAALPPSNRCQEFASFSVNAGDLRNGLNASENRTLAETPHIDEAMLLVLRGLHRLTRDA